MSRALLIAAALGAGVVTAAAQATYQTPRPPVGPASDDAPIPTIVPPASTDAASGVAPPPSPLAPVTGGTADGSVSVGDETRVGNDGTVGAPPAAERVPVISGTVPETSPVLGAAAANAIAIEEE